MKRVFRFSFLCVFIALSVSKASAETFSIKHKENSARSYKFSYIPPVPNPLPIIPLRQDSGWRPKKMELRDSFAVGDSTLGLEQGIYNWLCAQQDPLTGLVASFEGSIDPLLKDQASTYDQGLAGLSFLLLGDIERCRKVLDFFVLKFKHRGFVNFYSTLNGRVGIEWRRHVGPNMWIALLCYQYENFTQDKRYRPLVEGLCDWVLRLRCYDGGPAMSDEDESGIPWTEIVSTENVIDTVAVFEIAARITEDLRKKELYKKKLEEMKQFLKEIAIQPDYTLARGYRPFNDGLDLVPALDTTTWFVSIMRPEDLFQEYGVSFVSLMTRAEELFGVELFSFKGYDYTSSEEAKRAKRERMISIEWSAEMAFCYWWIMQNEHLSTQQRKDYTLKLDQLIRGLEAFRQQENDKISYPYASQAYALTFSDGWRTPKEKSNGELPGSIAGTCWRLFVEGWNPFILDQKNPFLNVKIVKKPYKESSQKEKKKAELEPSSYTSEGLSTAAWRNLSAKNYKEAREYAVQCIHLYSKMAKDLQFKKAEEEGGFVEYEMVDEEVKHRIHQYGPLNDVASCWFILSKIDSFFVPQATKMIHRYFSLAQIWDPRGWFWRPAEILTEGKEG